MVILLVSRKIKISSLEFEHDQNVNLVPVIKRKKIQANPSKKSK